MSGKSPKKSKPISPNFRRKIGNLPPQQKFCPITGLPLGSMGVPVKIVLKGQPVFLCCPGCMDEAKKDPDKTLKKVDELKKK